MDPNEKLIRSVILSCFGLIGTTIVVNQVMKKRLKPFKKVGIVKKLFIYPIKSLNPIEFDSLDYNELQIYWESLKDRAFMIVNRKNVMITLRQEPSLIKLQVTFDHPYLTVTTPDGSDSIKISILEDDYHNVDRSSITNQEIIQTDVWGYSIDGVNCGDEISKFFSRYLKKPEMKLIRFTDNMKHRPAEIYRDGQIIKDSNIKIMYHDTATCHLINTKSVEALNGWIKNNDEKVNFTNFRPNILIEADSFDEENWEKIRIGSKQSTDWQQLLKCVRCRVTTINHEKVNFMKEPLATLKSLHRPLSKQDLGYANTSDENGRQTAPLMGVFFKPEATGTVKVGQEIWASHKHGLFWFL